MIAEKDLKESQTELKEQAKQVMDHLNKAFEKEDWEKCVEAQALLGLSVTSLCIIQDLLDQ